jgi:hypothetical protein
MSQSNATHGGSHAADGLSGSVGGTQLGPLGGQHKPPTRLQSHGQHTEPIGHNPGIPPQSPMFGSSVGLGVLVGEEVVELPGSFVVLEFGSSVPVGLTVPVVVGDDVVPVVVDGCEVVLVVEVAVVLVLEVEVEVEVVVVPQDIQLSCGPLTKL